MDDSLELDGIALPVLLTLSPVCLVAAMMIALARGPSDLPALDCSGAVEVEEDGKRDAGEEETPTAIEGEICLEVEPAGGGGAPVDDDGPAAAAEGEDGDGDDGSDGGVVDRERG